MAGVHGFGVDRESVALLRRVHAHRGTGDPVLAIVLLLGLVFHLDFHHIRIEHAVAVGNQGEFDRSVGAQDRFAAAIARHPPPRDVAVGHDRAVLQLLAARIFEDELDVVVDVAAVLPVVEPAHAHHGLGVLVQDPVGHIDLVRHQLRAKTAGILAIQAPVELILEFGRGLAAPVRVAVPLGLDVRHVTDGPGIDEVLGALVELAVAPLQADLNELIGVRFVQRPQSVDFLGREDQGLLAEDMLARLEGSLHDREVQEQGNRDEDGLDRVVLEQLVVVGVGLRRAVKDLQCPVQVLLVNVTQRDAFAVLHMHQVAL